MSLPFLAQYTLSKENRERLDADPAFALQAFESLLGEPKRREPSSSGFIHFRCPTAGCDRNDHKFGVRFGTRFHTDTFGGFNCFRCGLRGKGFTTLCRMLGVDPGVYVAEGFTPTIASLTPVVHTPSRSVLDSNQFASFWRWIAHQSRLAYGNELNGLMISHAQKLASKSLDLSVIPQWFSMPPEETLDLAIQRWGLTMCQRAGLVYESGRDRNRFFNPGRIALVYPAIPGTSQNVPFGYLRSYDPFPQTELDRKRKVLSASGYASGDYLYLRVVLQPAVPEPWLITEGEVKAEASYQARVSTIGLPGVNAGRAALVNLIVLALELSGGVNPTCLPICFDKDVDPRTIGLVNMAFYDLVDHLRNEISARFHGYCPPIHRVEFPDSDQKVDIDAYIAGTAQRSNRHTAHAAWRNRIRAAIQAGEVGPRPESLQRTYARAAGGEDQAHGSS